MLGVLHSTHIGMTRMKSTSRSYIWWPNIDKNIEIAVKTYLECDKYKHKSPVADIHPWEWSAVPWFRVHVDHAGPFLRKLFLIAIDTHSKWLEVKLVPNTSTAVTVDSLTIFATP